MSIDYNKISKPLGGGHTIDRYDAKIGPFFVGAQDNGEGLWNWWIALAAQGPAAGEHAIFDSGCTLSWDRARHDIEDSLHAGAINILELLK